VLVFLRREYAFADPDDGPVMITREQIGEFLGPRVFQLHVEAGWRSASPLRSAGVSGPVIPAR
jgi:hypothetical protein